MRGKRRRCWSGQSYSHEAQGVLDLGRHLAVLGPLGRVLHEIHVPGVELVDVGETSGRERPQEVDRLWCVTPKEEVPGEQQARLLEKTIIRTLCASTQTRAYPMNKKNNMLCVVG